MNINDQLQFRLDEEGAEFARRLKQALSRFLPNEEDRDGFLLEEKDEPVDLPSADLRILLITLEALATRHEIIISPNNDDVTTTEAAEILNVSRPYVIKLLDEEKMPYRMVGTHRRIRYDDLMAYKDIDDQKRRKILDQLVKEAQSQKMGYHK